MRLRIAKLVLLAALATCLLSAGHAELNWKPSEEIDIYDESSSTRLAPADTPDPYLDFDQAQLAFVNLGECSRLPRVSRSPCNSDKCRPRCVLAERQLQALLLAEIFRHRGAALQPPLEKQHFDACRGEPIAAE